MKKLIARFKAWRDRRYWAECHMDFIRRHVLTDLRWLSVDPVGREIMERYEKITGPDWHKFAHEPIEEFRPRIGMCPHRVKKEGAA